MAESARTSYDEVPYGDFIIQHTHPSYLGAAAVLAGMTPASPERCRVLELGCAAGANLIPMGFGLPSSEFVGIDLSRRQIENGQQVIKALGQTNVDLRAGNLLEVNESFGRFDYIICHGVYSWVPAEVRDAILSICRANLADHGIAFVSYNTYPGWRLRGMVREMVNFHARQFTDPGERARQSRAVLNFMAQAAGIRDPQLGGLLRREAELMNKAADPYVLHEYLEEVNEPVYFYQFAERAAARGLQFVAEAPPKPVAQGLPPDVCNTLARLSRSVVQAEQYLDFVSNRSFRRSLMCHDHVQVRRPFRGESVTGLYLTGLVQPVAGAASAASDVEEWRGRDGGVSSNDPLLSAALRCLFEAQPAALAFDVLWQRVRARLPQVTDAHRLHLAEVMLYCHQARHVDLQTRPSALAIQPGERPRATPLARLQAAANQPVCNLNHQAVPLEAFDRLVLNLLDGNQGRQMLTEQVAKRVRPGDPQALRQAVDASLDRFARNALLIAAAAPTPPG